MTFCGAFQSLFANGERFYYVTLATDGLANTPYIAAWSHEAFERAYRLNDSSTDIFQEWLEDAAEPLDEDE